MGTVAFSTALLMSRALPRGTMRSMYPRMVSIWSTTPWPRSSTRQTASGVMPQPASASRITRTSSALDS